MSERGEAKRDGAKLQPNSGRGKFNKGDATLDGWCIDYKEYSKGFTVNKAAWSKVCTDAFRSGNLEPTIKIVLGEGRDVTRLFLISETMFHLMNEAYQEKHGEQV